MNINQNLVTQTKVYYSPLFNTYLTQCRYYLLQKTFSNICILFSSLLRFHRKSVWAFYIKLANSLFPKLFNHYISLSTYMHMHILTHIQNLLHHKCYLCY